MADPAVRLVCVGTHHKTGTVWMRKVFRLGTNKMGLTRINLGSFAPASEVPDDGHAVLVNWYSKFDETLLTRPDLRGIHLIRDPRDVLLSGARYHQIAPLKGEKPLHTPLKRLGGRTYQEHINSLPDDREKLLFEMENYHRETVSQMLAWNYDRPNFMELRYEDLIQDTDCSLFSQALDFLGYAGEEKEAFLDLYWEHSLFGGLKTEESRKGFLAAHVSSGKAQQWARKLPRDIAEIYAERYGEALIALGYETDHSWVADCPVEAPPLLSSNKKAG